MKSGDGLASECVAEMGADAGPDAGLLESPDATEEACDLTKPFAAATEVPGIHAPGANDVHGTLTDDELTIYFASDRADPTAKTMHLYSASRTSVDSPFGTPQLLAGLYSDRGDSSPSISSDGNTIYFDSLRVEQGYSHIFTSTRANATVAFPAPTMLAGDALITPSITADGNVLYAETLTTAGLVRFDRIGGGFSTPQPVILPTSGGATSPVSRDDLTLFMSQGEQNGNAILVSRRASTSVSFPAPTPVAELANGATIAEPSWISADGCRLYLRYRFSGDTSRIYVATRPK